MTKFVVSGYIGFDNFGDEAIASVLVDKLKQEGADKITLISSNPDKTAKLYDVNSCKMFGFFKSLKDADVLISGGGSLLQDVTSLKSLLYYLGVIYSALLLRKQVIIFAQGIGPINSLWGKILTKFALKNAKQISVRDKKSQDLLGSWGISSDLVKDPIFSINIPILHKEGVVGVQLRNFPSLSDEFLDALAKTLVQRFGDKDIQVLSLQDSIDKDICEHFAKCLVDNGYTKKVEVLFGLDLRQIIDKIANFEYLIAMRFHANVVAIKAEVKTLAINYDIKVQKLAEEYKIPLINLNQRYFNDKFDELLNL